MVIASTLRCLLDTSIVLLETRRSTPAARTPACRHPLRSVSPAVGRGAATGGSPRSIAEWGVSPAVRRGWEPSRQRLGEAAAGPAAVRRGEASPVKRGERPPGGATAAGLAECDGQAFGHHTRRLFAAHKRQTGVHIGVSVWSQSVRTGNGTPAPSHTSATAGTWRPRDLTKASVGKYNSLRKENPATCGRLQGSATVQRPTQHTSQPVRCRRSRRCWAGRSVGLSVRRGCKSVDGRLDCLIAPN